MLKHWKPTPLGTISFTDNTGKRGFLRYTSFTIPYRIYLIEEEFSLWEESSISGRFEVLEEWTNSWDKTPIHMFVLKRRGTC